MYMDWLMDSSKSGARRLTALVGAAMLAVLVSACGGGGEAAPEAPPQQKDTGKVKVASLTDATTHNELPKAPMDTNRHGKTEGEVIHPKKELIVYDSVNGQPIAALPEEQLSSPTWVPVIDRKGDWARILLPTRPNGASGWVKASKQNVESAQNNYRVKVDLSEFSLTVFHKGKQVHQFTIGIGKPKHPTPTGRSFILASVEETKDDYSDYILPLSVHSNTLKTFGGGPGTVGIHTWPDNSFMGERNSDGCIRVTPQALDQLMKLPLGTIVDIVK